MRSTRSRRGGSIFQSVSVPPSIGWVIEVTAVPVNVIRCEASTYGSSRALPFDVKRRPSKRGETVRCGGRGPGTGPGSTANRLIRLFQNAWIQTPFQ